MKYFLTILLLGSLVGGCASLNEGINDLHASVDPAYNSYRTNIDLIRQLDTAYLNSEVSEKEYFVKRRALAEEVNRYSSNSYSSGNSYLCKWAIADNDSMGVKVHC